MMGFIANKFVDCGIYKNVSRILQIYLEAVIMVKAV